MTRLYYEALGNFMDWLFSAYTIEHDAWMWELLENVSVEVYSHYKGNDFAKHMSEIIPEITEDDVKEHFNLSGPNKIIANVVPIDQLIIWEHELNVGSLAMDCGAYMMVMWGHQSGIFVDLDYDDDHMEFSKYSTFAVYDYNADGSKCEDWPTEEIWKDAVAFAAYMAAKYNIPMYCEK